MASILELHQKGYRYVIDLESGLDVSIPLVSGDKNPNCFYAKSPVFEPVRGEGFVGDTLLGGVVNFKDVSLNPHGNGTHTECVGHISKEPYFINDVKLLPFIPARIVSVNPATTENGDRIIKAESFSGLAPATPGEAIVVRTLPNYADKKLTNYSGSNPAYFHHESIAWLVYLGFEHLLTDLPSVDREEDGGKLAGHKAWWKYPGNTRLQATITEMIYVEDTILDGRYLLQLSVLNWELDVSPSRPVLYPLISFSTP